MAQAFAWTRREVWTRKLLYPGHTLPDGHRADRRGHRARLSRPRVRRVPALLAFLAGWLIQFAGVVTDNYTNLVRQPDDREHPELVEAVKTGLLSLADLKTTIFAQLRAGRWCSVSRCSSMAGWPVIVIGLASILASWAYSAGPFPFGRHGFADPSVLPVLRHGVGARHLLRAGGRGARARALARGVAVDGGRGEPADRRADHQHSHHRRHPRLGLRRGQGQEHDRGALRQDLEPRASSSRCWPSPIWRRSGSGWASASAPGCCCRCSRCRWRF